MPIIVMDYMWRADLRAHPNWLFVFGDNLAQTGFGGQAKECRGEPNAVGIPTKALPSNTSRAFLYNQDMPIWRTCCKVPFQRIEQALADGKTVAFPSSGIGTGRAKLEEKAPRIWKELQTWVDKLMADYYDPHP
jgi:hypothetical protein